TCPTARGSTTCSRSWFRSSRSECAEAAPGPAPQRPGAVTGDDRERVPVGPGGQERVQASSLSAVQELTIRSTGTPQAAARSQPYGCQSSCPGACASVSTANEQPASTAKRSSRLGGSSRSGRELISTATW